MNTDVRAVVRDAPSVFEDEDAGRQREGITLGLTPRCEPSVAQPLALLKLRNEDRSHLPSVQTVASVVMASGSSGPDNGVMNQYFKPRTPEPKTSAVGIILRSMMCTFVVLVVGAGIWLAQDAIRQDRGSDKLTRDGRSESSTNYVVVHVPDTPR